MNPEDLFKLCETEFQNGGGKAQVRAADGWPLLLGSFATKRDALNSPWVGQLVLYRDKERGRNRWTWRIVAGTLQ